MNGFISQYSDQISGVITGFDRLVFRGNLAWNHETGRKGYRGANGIAWKDYINKPVKLLDPKSQRKRPRIKQFGRFIRVYRVQSVHAPLIHRFDCSYSCAGITIGRLCREKEKAIALEQQ